MNELFLNTLSLKNKRVKVESKKAKACWMNERMYEWTSSFEQRSKETVKYREVFLLHAPLFC